VDDHPVWFVVSADNPRLYVPSATQSYPGPPVDRAALVVPGSSPSLGVYLSVEDAWQVPGAVMAFFGSAPFGLSGVAAAVDELLSNPALGDTAAVWIDNPNLPVTQWRTRTLPVSRRTSMGGEVPALAVLPLRNFGIRIAGGSGVTVMPATAEWRVDAPASARDPLELTVRYGAAAAELVSPLRIAVGPAAPGTLSFDLQLQPQLEQPFDLGLHFFAEDPDLSNSGLLRASRLALTPVPPGGLRLRAQIDPLALTDPDRSCLRLDLPRRQLASRLFDAYGRALELTLLDDFRLALTEAPATMAPEVDAALCLTPVGGASMTGTSTLLLGLAGSEAMGLAAGTTKVQLEPGGAALATALAPDGSSSPLSSRATTSWVRLSADADATYYAQPTGAELHSTTKQGEEFLPFRPLRVASVSPGVVFPLAPWGGADLVNTAFDTALETTAVSPARRALMSEAPPRPSTLGALAGVDDPLPTAITPQGLVATIQPDGTFCRLRLAHVDGAELALGHIRNPLLGALMTNRQFAVISDATVVASIFHDHEITVDEWRLSVEPATWAQHGTMMIFKNSPRSVADLAGEPTSWTLGATLNLFLDQTATQLAAYVSKTLELAKTDDSYAPIAQALTDPAWNGILFANAAAPLKALPPSLSGLAAGIDASRFYAHHLRIDATSIEKPQPGAATPGTANNSSVFALIDYTAAPETMPATGQPYAFRVDYLRVLIENSAVSTFSSQVTLLAQQLFGAPVSKMGDTGRLVFAGHYQKQQDSYFFALAPQLHQPPLTVNVDDATIDSFTITAATFATVDDPPSSDPGAASQVHSRFSLDGMLKFGRTASDFDLFGFDALPVSGIAIDVRFDREQPQFAKLAFDPTIALIGTTDLEARPGSLTHGFPMTPRSFLAGGPAQDPSQLPVMPVSVAEPWNGPTAPWYGLQFDLDLGTAGALASDAGLVARFVLQWSPATQTGRWAVGLGLPGATGGSTSISLMGVLKLSIYAIELVRLKNGGFMLVLEGIALSVFGHSIPPGGAITLAVFGDPATQAGGSSPLAWYGAYTADRGTAVGTTNKQEAGT
jgi:hypothetical protein